MKKTLRLFILAVAALPLLASCNKSASDYPKHQHYAVLNVESLTGGYSFTLDDGTTCYPADKSRFSTYDTYDKNNESKEGRRIVAMYNILPDEAPAGYDISVAVYGIADILTGSVDVATTEEDVERAGDNKLTVNAMAFGGSRWLDMVVFYNSGLDATHKFTLMYNETATAPEDMPEGYTYLELRQSADDDYSTTYYDYLSFDLGGYAPAVTGKKGLYIRVNDLNNGLVKYIKLDYSE